MNYKELANKTSEELIDIVEQFINITCDRIVITRDQIKSRDKYISKLENKLNTLDGLYKYKAKINKVDEEAKKFKY